MSMENKKLDCKTCVRSLSTCTDVQEIFHMLDKTMDRKTLKERIENIDKLSDKTVDLILNFHATSAAARSKQDKGNIKITHQDCVNVAVVRYKELTGLGFKGFKAALNKYHTQKAQNQSIEMAVDTKQFYDLRRNLKRA